VSTLKVNNVQDLGADAVVTDGVIDSGALPAGSILQVVSVLKTDTFSASVAVAASIDVTGLSITHQVSNPSNKLLITAYFGAASTSQQAGSLGIAVANDGTLIGVGDTAGSRVSVGAGGQIAVSSSTAVVSMPSISLLYEPGDTSSHTYTVRILNVSPSTRTMYVNRSEQDGDTTGRSRAASALTLMEVAG